MVTYLKALIGSKIKNERGQGMIEYGLIAAFISIIAIATIKLIGPNIETIFSNIKAALEP